MSILYKFIGQDRIIDTKGNTYFENQLLRITQPGDLNDPFECLPSYYNKKEFKTLCIAMKNDMLRKLEERNLSDQEMELEVSKYEYWQKVEIKKYIAYNPDNFFTKYFENARAEINSKTGILSLTRIWDNILMWSHYTQSHTGICIGFDSDDPFFADYRKQNLEIFLTPVIYSKNRVSLPTERSPIINGEFLYSKSIDWKYEKEERMIVSLSKSTTTAKGGLFDIHLFEVPHKLIKELVLGANTTIEVQNKIKDFSKKMGIKLYKAEISRNRYKMERHLL